MWHTIILLSLALAVSIGFWIRADRMAAHYRREAEETEIDYEEMRCIASDWYNQFTKQNKELVTMREEVGRLQESLSYEKEKHDDLCRMCQKEIEKEKKATRSAVDTAHSLKFRIDTTRRQLAAARGQITKLRRKYGEIE